MISSIQNLSETKKADLASKENTTLIIDNSLLITQARVEQRPQKNTEIFSYEKCPVEHLINVKDKFLPLHIYFNINLVRVQNNIMNTLSFLTAKTKSGLPEYDKNEWSGRLSLEEHKNIVTDGFWLFLLKKNAEIYKGILGNQYNDIENALLDRICLDYVSLLEKTQGKDNGIEKKNSQDHALFFQIYFDLVAQGVFYSFFYAFPKSRDEFNDKFKKEIFDFFAYQFTGMYINPKSRFIKGKDYEFISKWCLDLGAGDVLKKIKKKQSEENDLPLVELSKLTIKQAKPSRVAMRFSPIMQRYIYLKNYQTKNYLKSNNIKLSKYDVSQEIYEKKFQTYEKHMNEASALAKKFGELIREKKIYAELNKKIFRIKTEALEHVKRLEKRRNEELEKGAHEYANYLVSMMNAENQVGGRKQQL